LAIVGAEYLLVDDSLGTHDFSTFIRPSELCQWARQVDLELAGLEGVIYNPLTGH
jgi:2-polyprenyl-6-hydroxyphenyl methylase/3-demethylubiquinone-9 3-methyltransferase